MARVTISQSAADSVSDEFELGLVPHAPLVPSTSRTRALSRFEHPLEIHSTVTVKANGNHATPTNGRDRRVTVNDFQYLSQIA